MPVDDIPALYRAFVRDLAELTGAQRFDATTNLRLDRITNLLNRLGNPERAFPAIHIAGTSGKGSTAAMTAAILTSAGYKTGLFLSPHLQIVNECYQINGRLVSTTRLSACLAHIKPVIAQIAEQDSANVPTLFEIQTALACTLFQQEQVDVAVIEVGLGGTSDATNVIPAQVAVITAIGFDHTDVLGNTIEAITQAKAGIIKPGQTVVSGVQQPAARAIVAQRCQANQATLWQMDQAFDHTLTASGQLTLHIAGQTYADLSLALPGQFQAANAACAVAAAQAFSDDTLPEPAVRQSLQQVHLPGRLEVVQSAPTVILDGAHNPDKLQAVVQVITERYAGKRRIVVLGVKADKDVPAMLPYVLNATDLLIVTAFRTPALWEPLTPETLAEQVATRAPQLPVQVIPDPIQAIEQALSAAHPADLVWVTGSLYLVGDVREYWYPTATLLAQLEQAEQ